jgi:hypothetical protein
MTCFGNDGSCLYGALARVLGDLQQPDVVLFFVSI